MSKEALQDLVKSIGTTTSRWTTLRAHAIQYAYWTSVHRFNVVPAGRRSGKTELAKRKVVRASLNPNASKFPDPHYFCAAPTRDQAKRIYWDDLKAMIPKSLIVDISETELTIWTVLNSSISVVGMDKPERIEGSPWDGGILDEFGNMKGHAWGANVRPALSDRLGWCDLIGVPEGRNHYYDMAEMARTMVMEQGDLSEWGLYHWLSADILPRSEIEAAKRELDPLTYEQEYEASFVNFTGRAYYTFTDANRVMLEYNPKADLILCFDFNVDPGVAVIAQEMRMPWTEKKWLPAPGGQVLIEQEVECFGTGIIGEVHIPVNSNTPAVCNRLIQDWGRHEGRVRCYGDASGGARGTARVSGSDWEIIRDLFRPVFGGRVSYNLRSANPPERSRVNAVNTRCCNGAGFRHLAVDPRKAPNVVKDLEGVRTLQGGSGEIDKNADRRLTHLSDALGYYIEYEYPVTDVRGVNKMKTTGR